MKLNMKSLTSSTIYTIVIITLATIISELSKPFKEFLASITGHHWVSKSILSLIFFVLVYYLGSKFCGDKSDFSAGKKVFITTIVSSLVIFLFYVWHYFS